MSRRRGSIAVCCTVFAGVVLADVAPWRSPNVSAATVSFQLSGTLSFVESSGAPGGPFFLAPQATVGAPFTGLLTYDLSTPPGDATGAPWVQVYRHSPPTGSMGLSITIGSQTFATNPQTGFDILVSNAAPGGAFPQYDAFGFASGGHDALGDFDDSLTLSLRDSTGEAFSSPSLPTMLNVDDFDVAPFGREIQVHRTSSVVVGFPPRAGAFYSLVGTVNTITLVPEPSTLALGVASVLAWWMFTKWPRSPSQRPFQ